MKKIINTYIDSILIECPICYEIKSDTFSGNCTHSWCLECHSKMYKYYTCPICREPYRIPPPKPNEIWIGPPTSPINVDLYNANSPTRRHVIRELRILRNISNRRQGRRSNIINSSRRTILCSCTIS